MPAVRNVDRQEVADKFYEWVTEVYSHLSDWPDIEIQMELQPCHVDVVATFVDGIKMIPRYHYTWVWGMSEAWYDVLGITEEEMFDPDSPQQPLFEKACTAMHTAMWKSEAKRPAWLHRSEAFMDFLQAMN